MSQSLGSSRPFRFGVNLLAPAPLDEWRAKCRRAEDLGYDVILVPDHLGMPAPFPSLVAAAEVTERPRLGTFVLNAGFWNPTLLAREVATTDTLTGGRLELGLGTGYIRAEHDTAGLPWGSPRERVDHLRRTVEELESLLGSDEHQPGALQRPRVPLLIGANGDRMLRLTAERADIAAFTGARTSPGGTLEPITAAALDERVARYREAAEGRKEPAELNLLIQVLAVTEDRGAAIRALAAPSPEPDRGRGPGAADRAAGNPGADRRAGAGAAGTVRILVSDGPGAEHGGVRPRRRGAAGRVTVRIAGFAGST